MTATTMLSTSFIVNVTSYFSIGLVLIIINLPVSYAILKNKELRVRYGVLLSLFITSSLAGFAGFSKAVYRIVIFFATRATGSRAISMSFCILNPIILCDIYTFGAVAIILLSNSVDRLLAVSIPVRYFLCTKRIIFWELAITHLFAVSVFLIALTMCAISDNGTATIECRQSSYFPSSLYTWLACMRALLSAMSTVVMGFVLVMLKRLTSESRAFTNDQKLTAFRAKQQRFTITMIISCVVTLALDVVPNCVSMYAHLKQLPDIDNYTTYTRFVTYMNAMNLVLVTNIRQSEIREELFYRMRFVCGIFRCIRPAPNSQIISTVQKFRK